MWCCLFIVKLAARSSLRVRRPINMNRHAGQVLSLSLFFFSISNSWQSSCLIAPPNSFPVQRTVQPPRSIRPSPGRKEMEKEPLKTTPCKASNNGNLYKSFLWTWQLARSTFVLGQLCLSHTQQSQHKRAIRYHSYQYGLF